MSDRRIRSPLTSEEKREVWGEFAGREEEYLDEVERRWGDSTAYAQSARRVAAYGKEQWERINHDNAVIEARIRELMDAGEDPSGETGMDVAEAQRRHIARWFYDMTHEFHVRKSDLYVDDPRFRAGIEANTRPGAAEWLRTAIRANADRADRADRAGHAGRDGRTGQDAQEAQDDRAGRAGQDGRDAGTPRPSG
ncbi:TipAS antibiotic-recognition domain-containing protein [Streptosporangium sp. DT93]|uniref:TipAS antibiotic-recognition domain-containing protein n=1 Tax=Streptosporangium sp. DT93 TaxID=3393428 RepID=UPI003CEA89B0